MTDKTKKCDCCEREQETVERRRENTAYIDKEQNYIVCCLDCYDERQEMWKDMWEEYYASVM